MESASRESRRTLFFTTTDMKRILYLLQIATVTMLVVSCGQKQQKSQEDRVASFRSELTLEDTTAMLRLCDEAMESLKAKEVDKVIASLHEYDDSTREVKPLSDLLAKRYTRQFTMFPVLDYKREYFSFIHEGCNDVKYKVTFATAEQAGTEDAPTTMYMFNPVKVDGEWKLCVKTPEDGMDADQQ